MRKEVLASIGLGIAAFEISKTAFTVGTRKEIGRRDNWECKHPDCDDGYGQPKSFKNGWMVHAAHSPENHKRSDPEYDNTGSGNILCVDHHIQQHRNGTALGTRGDETAIISFDRFNELWKFYMDCR